ncbi:MAG: OmpA family protein [Bacteroidota bacterium]
MTRSATLALLIVLLCGYSGTTAQVSEKKIHKKARQAFERNRIPEAVELYGQLLALQPANCEYNYGMGEAYYYWDVVKVRCIPYLEKALACTGTGNNDADIYFFLADCYHLSGSYEKAIEYFEKYLQQVLELGTFLPKNERGKLEAEVKLRVAQCKNALELEKAPFGGMQVNGENRNVQVVMLGASINGPEDDYSCVLASDTVLYFASRRSGSSKGKTDYWDDKLKEDIYFSVNTLGSWETARSIGSAINTKNHEAPDYVSPDGRRLYFYRGIRQGTVYLSEKNAQGGWDKPRRLQKGRKINTPNWETSFSFTMSGKTVYFASNRKGGYGGRDLYRSVQNDDGSWSDPENLGPDINTPYDEDAPFLSADGTTLYFSSTGHNSMGGFDLFFSKPAGSKWGKPVNMGLPFNSPGDDIYLTIDSKSVHAYFASNRVSSDRNDMNIYSVYIEQKKDTVVLASDQVKKDTVVIGKSGTNDQKDEKPLPAYGNVLFGLEKHSLQPQYLQALDQLAEYLKSNTDVTVSLIGYTDLTGTDAYNLELSQKRAGAVRAYLLENGVSPGQVSVSGKGKDRPAADNSTKEGRRQNRRVEIILSR